MLSVRSAAQASQALIDKGLGLTMETVGTLWGNDRLKEAGRMRQDAASERLRAIEEEAKATKLTVDAGRRPGEGPSVTHATASGIKGTVKQVAGAVSGNDDLEEEGRVQKDKARDEVDAVGHDAKAKAHREKADVLRSASDRIR